MRFTSRRGFSLIELVICLAIVVTVAGLASVRFSGSAQRARIDAAANKIVSMIDDCRGRALTSGAETKIDFDVGNSRLTVKGTVTDDATLDTLNLAAAPYSVKLTAADFNGSAELHFTTFGRPLAGGFIDLSLGGHSKRIALDSETGRAKIQ
jgi:prepilin-type N-terminal cleavage/methylation domain-containing protein